MSKNLARLKKRFKATDWYKQAAAAKLLYPSYPARACVDFRIRGKQIQYFYKGFAFYETSRNYWHVFLSKQNMLENARYYLGRQWKDPAFITRFARHWEDRVVKTFLGELSLSEKSNLPALSDRELVAAFKRFSKAYDRLWQESIFLDSFDYASDLLIPELLEEFNIPLSGEELALFLSPEKLSWLQREKQSLLLLVSRARCNAALARAIRRSELIASIKQKHAAWFMRLERHAAAYHWIYNDYATVHNLEPAHFLREVRQLLVNKKESAAERANIAHVKKSAVRKQKLARRLRLPAQLVDLLSFFVTLAAFRDSRKAYNQMANAAVLKFAKELSIRSRVRLPLVEEALWWEVASIRALQKLVPEFQRRKQGNLFYNDRGRHIAVLTGSNAKALFRVLEQSFGNHKTLSGKSAYAGVVRGVVRLVRSQGEFKKMRRGNILVAPNTRPEYVPIMKLAGAIVTEEGGITSHASIVSRELKIPCVVGVQGVMSLLKDGDRVGVDAERGIVRKI